jgi:hypothetical protein
VVEAKACVRHLKSRAKRIPFTIAVSFYNAWREGRAKSSFNPARLDSSEACHDSKQVASRQFSGTLSVLLILFRTRLFCRCATFRVFRTGGRSTSASCAIAAATRWSTHVSFFLPLSFGQRDQSATLSTAVGIDFSNVFLRLLAAIHHGTRSLYTRTWLFWPYKAQIVLISISLHNVSLNILDTSVEQGRTLKLTVHCC